VVFVDGLVTIAVHAVTQVDRIDRRPDDAGIHHATGAT